MGNGVIRKGSKLSEIPFFPLLRKEMALFNFQCQNDAVNVLYLEIRNVFHKKLQTNCELVRYPILGTTTSDMLEPPARRK